MTFTPKNKYQPFPPINLPNREWPGKSITEAPIWCSVDIRDGNQALIEPMDAHRKLRFFNTLIKMGFKEIEVGFPAASETDFDFVRKLIEEDLIPDDVYIQVLTQARDHLIERTFESIKGAKRVIIHLYNSTSTLQRRVVFGMDTAGITSIATHSAKLCRSYADSIPDTEFMFEYSPESFTGTELEYAKEICEAVMDVWGASSENKIILNLPSTVEMATPNVYADQIEWFSKNIKNRNSVILSAHLHNDRGTAVAAAELALMAGAERVEGTLFGNGERTGNVDAVTLALNLYSQGIDPKLDISNINEIRETVEYCNQIPVHVRHPYVGELVYTAFSGSHQDAIKKGMAALEKSNSPEWQVPYLPIDPKDVGRDYDSIVRINSQSGKGGVAYILNTEYGLDLPYNLQVDFSRVVQGVTEASGQEITSEMIWELFNLTYVSTRGSVQYLDHENRIDTQNPRIRKLSAHLIHEGKNIHVTGKGSGPIEAMINAVNQQFDLVLRVESFVEHSLQAGTDASACAYIDIRSSKGDAYWGVGMDQNVTAASLQAILSVVSQALTRIDS